MYGKKFFFNLIKRTLFFCEICNFCMTYETEKSAAFFCVLLRSFIKNVTESKERNVLL